MAVERQLIENLFEKLSEQQEYNFPKLRTRIDAPTEQGVYIIRKGKQVLHVGRTTRGRNGISQRLKNHLNGASSFTRIYLKGKGHMLREGHSYQCLIVEKSRQRALLEAYTIGILCPKHIGLGE